MQFDQTSPYNQQVPAYNQPTSAFYATPETVANQSWYVDSGATNHIITDMNNLSMRSEYRGKEKLIVGDGNQLTISHIGDTKVHSHTVPHQDILLKKVLHVPSITKNVLSISRLTKDNNAFVEFNDFGCVIKGKRTKKVLLEGTLRNGLY
ncbi:hypothetical protein ACOSP7_030228 [Xanthoceras sorbifolium]